jgi:hypothetical protein
MEDTASLLDPRRTHHHTNLAPKQTTNYGGERIVTNPSQRCEGNKRVERRRPDPAVPGGASMATVTIREWVAKFRQRGDAAAVERAKATANETPEEQAVTSGDPTAAAADEQAARISGQTPAEANRGGDE